MEQNQQGGGQNRGRRGNFHRGRRGPDRRPQGGQEPRAAQSSESQGPRGDQVDIEQIMRDIRSRIAHRHGIDLSAQQIHELAARRLEAILDPRNVNPSLLDQLRKSAGARPVKDVVSPPADPPYVFEETTLYDSHRSLLRSIRKLLNPILRLFFNPSPVSQALTAQTRLNAELVARESERDQRQAEWNALQYELLQRVVTESAKSSIELQALTLRVESLAARVDFADRRVRSLEAVPVSRHGGRPAQEPQVTPVLVAVAEPRVDSAAPMTAVASDAAAPDGQRKRRRRRRGRRSGGSPGEAGQSPAESSAMKDAGAEDFDDNGEDTADGPEEGESEELSVEMLPDSGHAQVDAPVRMLPQPTEDAAVSAAPTSTESPDTVRPTEPTS